MPETANATPAATPDERRTIGQWRGGDAFPFWAAVSVCCCILLLDERRSRSSFWLCARADTQLPWLQTYLRAQDGIKLFRVEPATHDRKPRAELLDDPDGIRPPE